MRGSRKQKDNAWRLALHKHGVDDACIHRHAAALTFLDLAAGREPPLTLEELKRLYERVVLASPAETMPLTEATLLVLRTKGLEAARAWLVEEVVVPDMSLLTQMGSELLGCSVEEAFEKMQQPDENVEKARRALAMGSAVSLSDLTERPEEK